MRRKLWLSNTLRMDTAVFLWLGTSMPTAGLPGMGASIRTSATARFRAISSASEVMRLILTPAMGCTSYRVTEGPREISSTRVRTPKAFQRVHQLLGVGLQLLLAPGSLSSCDFSNSSMGGYWYS